MVGADGRSGPDRTASIEEALTGLVADPRLLRRLGPVDIGPDGNGPDGIGRDPAADPATLLLDGAQLVALRSALDAPKSAQVRAALRSISDAALANEPSWVTDKPQPGPSGDRHDYVSLARYWWPDPEAPSGEPYVRRDGEPNPACDGPTVDASRLARFADDVLTLALCGYLLRDDALLGSAAGRLRGWLVDPRTRQNPNFEFGQLVRGRKAVRAPAVVDARRTLWIAEAFRLVRSAGALGPADEAAMRSWFGDLLDWLLTSAPARAAAQARNNVAAWCQLERVVLADLVGREAVVVDALAEAGRLLSDQVLADGGLPAEISRRNPADYAAFAFIAMAMLVRVGREHGVDLWDPAAATGRGLSAARDWLAAVGSGAVDPQAQAETVVLGLRLLTWREDAYRLALLRAEDLADRLGRREAEVARLTARLDRSAAQRTTVTVRVLGGRGAPAGGARGRRLLDDVRSQARSWPVIGPVGRRVARTVRERGLTRASQRPTSVQVDESAVAARLGEYRRAAVTDEAPTFVLYRILGNDLPPRHRPGQTSANLRFILDHEPDLPDCEKRWIINRIHDPALEEELLALLRAADHPVLRLPFDPVAYAAQDFEVDRLPVPDYLTTPAWERSRPDLAARAVNAAYRRKNLYAMNNNGARNAALDDGRHRATWILPFDGSTYFTAAGWSALRSAVRSRPEVPYVVVPMCRVSVNDDVLGRAGLPVADEEPQIAFRRDAVERFDVQRPYGRRPKVDLLWRLGVPGPWQRWPRDPWDPPFPRASADHGCFQVAGSVVRLAAGDGTPEVGGRVGLRFRGASREAAIVARLRHLDGRAVQTALPSDGLLVYDSSLLGRLTEGEFAAARALLVAHAEAAVGRGPFAVTDKPEAGPSGDPHDYWHPAPYWWPDRSRATGLPYVRRDGHRAPGTELFSSSSDRYDRSRMFLAFHDVVALALAARVTGQVRYAAHAACQVRTWFLDERTAMTPNLRYAQVRRGHDRDQGQASGVIELRDIAYLLDAVQLLIRDGHLDAVDVQGLRSWFGDYLSWLLHSPQGVEEQQAANNHGTCYDLQVLAICGFLGEGELFADAALRATGRLRAHFDPVGRQPRELGRTQTRHYCAYNLASWLDVARVAQAGGVDLWSTRDAGGPIARGIDWYLAMQTEGWPFPQRDSFDELRDVPLAMASRLLHEPGVSITALLDQSPAAAWVLGPHDGHPPFWPLALGPRRRGGSSERREGAQR